MLIVATGGQGERAALGRIAFGNHEIKLAEGDTVIFSSKQIPGNEVAIGRIMNALSELGALTVTERQAHVHVSGHPGRLSRPNVRGCACILVPVHGESRPPAGTGAVRALSCASRRRWCRKWPYHPARPEGAGKVGNVRVGRPVLDGDVILPADGPTINERRKIALNGLVTVMLAVGANGKLAGDPPGPPIRSAGWSRIAT